MEVDAGQGSAGPAGCSFFLFLAGLNPTFNPTLYNPTKNRGQFLRFWGKFLLQFEVGLGLVGLG
jgi:hypothetical protein